jgi:hypothetical protein
MVGRTLLALVNLHCALLHEVATQRTEVRFMLEVTLISTNVLYDATPHL